MTIILEHLTKRFDRHPVVNNVSLEINQGDFFVLLGSSGSGKTTILNMIAGLTMMSSGRIILNGRDVSHLAPQERRLGYVFQHYALFQHMTINENIEFGLRIHKTPKPERTKRREQLLEMVGLIGLGNRFPRQLSGGQQQRVALARALAYEPEALLLDEPFGALDSRIRVELRRTMRSIQRELGITTILVTHDQEEAFDLADRIGVMNYGRLIETGTPQQLYQYPKSEYVASFLGTANLLVTNASQGVIQLGQGATLPANESSEAGHAMRVQVLFRPEDVILSEDPDVSGYPSLGIAEVEESSFVGPVERLRLRLPPIPHIRPIAPAVPFGSKSILVEASRPPEGTARLPLQPGDHVHLGIRRAHTLVNPGLLCLFVTDGSLRSQAALGMSSEIARSTHARVTVLGTGQGGTLLDGHLQEIRRGLSTAVASLNILTSTKQPELAVLDVVEQQPYDLIVMGYDATEHAPLVKQILQSGEHHLLLVSQPKTTLSKVLIYISNRQFSNNGIYFPGRLAYHMGIKPTLLTVLSPEMPDSPYERDQAQHLLESGARSLDLFGVQADTKLRTGVVHEEIIEEIREGGYDLVVLDAPAYGKSDEKYLRGVVNPILESEQPCPTLLVQAKKAESLISERFDDYQLI